MNLDLSIAILRQEEGLQILIGVVLLLQEERDTTNAPPGSVANSMITNTLLRTTVCHVKATSSLILLFKTRYCTPAGNHFKSEQWFL